MIVSPDFPDHWKTRLVVKKTGSEAAVRCILRLWGHCQQRRRWKFPELDPETLASICGWDGPVQAFWDAMLGTFIDLVENGFEVHDWAQANAALLSNWQKGQFGKDGGRPRKNPEGLPKVPDEKPSANPGITRYDKIGEEVLPEPKGSSSAAVAADPVRYDEVKELFHRLCPSLPKLRSWTDQRKAAVRSRWKAANGQALERFQELFAAAEASDFLAGRNGEWTACCFDWLLKPGNAQKVLEGNYTNKAPVRANVSSHSALPQSRPIEQRTFADKKL